jgi:hypothetical protein
MVAPYVLSESAVLPVSPEAAYDAVLAAPLEDILGSRVGLVPAITGCAGQDGPWGTVGQTRTIEMSDGTRALETLVLADRPTDYRYRISDVRGLMMRPLVAGIDGRFVFEQAGAGTRVTWSWEMRATNPVTRLLLPALGPFWHRWARRMFDLLAARVTT